MADARENDASNFAKMFDKRPAFDPPDNNSAGAIALRAWVRGVTARRPPALAFQRKYEEESLARTYDSFLRAVTVQRPRRTTSRAPSCMPSRRAWRARRRSSSTS